MATFLEESKNRSIWCKDCENRSSGSWDNFFPSDH